VEVVVFEGGGNFDLGGLGVFEGVGEGLLGDHAEVMNGGAGERGKIGGEVPEDLRAGFGGLAGGEFLEGDGEVGGGVVFG
jgi:hypothetical protein